MLIIGFLYDPARVFLCIGKCYAKDGSTQTFQRGPWHKTRHKALPEDTPLSVSASIWVTALLLKDSFLPPVRLRRGPLACGGCGAISLVDEQLHPFLPSQTPPSDLSHHLTRVCCWGRMYAEKSQRSRVDDLNSTSSYTVDL